MESTVGAVTIGKAQTSDTTIHHLEGLTSTAKDSAESTLRNTAVYDYETSSNKVFFCENDGKSVRSQYYFGSLTTMDRERRCAYPCPIGLLEGTDYCYQLLNAAPSDDASQEDQIHRHRTDRDEKTPPTTRRVRH
ncbi:unnamed protein product [Nippostrongylus brasiliensis]|uniref:Uncharacterized protein n=1 Tax=Nippostrongylus brasiliensis TaxID=27835 RepID=A0A0N4YKZ7_NIPBR|nr:unnamed protein product [Nippostrongylus brasiliensis]